MVLEYNKWFDVMPYNAFSVVGGNFITLTTP